MYNGALTAPSFATSSDDRLKHNEKDITTHGAAPADAPLLRQDVQAATERAGAPHAAHPSGGGAGGTGGAAGPGACALVTADPNGMLGVDTIDLHVHAGGREAAGCKGAAPKQA